MITFEKETEAKSYTELFTHRSSFRRLLLAVSIQASVQMTGVSAIQYYSPTIFAQIGIPGSETLKYQGISSIIAIIAQFCCILFIDYTGRRWAMIGGNLVSFFLSFPFPQLSTFHILKKKHTTNPPLFIPLLQGNCLTFIIASILLSKFPPGESNNKAASWGFIVITWIYNFSFSATNGPLSWIIPAEIFDTRTRSKGVSIATMTSFAFNTMIGQVTPIAIERIGWKFYLVFVVCNFTNAIWFWGVLPETKKLPLEEMNYLFTNAPLFVPSMHGKEASFRKGDLEERVMREKMALEGKGRLGSVVSHVEVEEEERGAR